MEQGESDLDVLLERLATETGNQQHRKALKTANLILQANAEDEDALRCKAIAHMQLSEFQEAFDVIQHHLTGTMPFEKAYCLYKLGRIEEASAALGSCGREQEEARLQLEAQLQYRMSNAAACIALYEKLFQTYKTDSVELKTNVVAAYVAANKGSEIPTLMGALKINPRQSFELGFNRGCGLVQVADYAAAEAELRMALKNGRESLFQEDCSEAQVDEELAPVTVQLAFVLARRGKVSEAIGLMESVLGQELPDEVTRVVAMNNVAADGGRVDASPNNRKYVNNVIKRLEGMMDKSTPGPGNLKFNARLDSRLSAVQKLALLANRALLYSLAGRGGDARALAEALRLAFPAEVEPALIMASLLARDGKTIDADRLLDEFCRLQPGAALPAALLRAQLAAEAGNLNGVLALLDSPGVPSTAPAVVATRVSIYEQLNDVAGAERALEAARSSWLQQQQSPAGQEGVSWCSQQLVALKLRLAKLGEASTLYRQMTNNGPPQTAGQAEVLSRLVRATAVGEPSAAAATAAALPSLAAEVRGIDVGALEAGITSRQVKRAEGKGSKKRAASDMVVDEGGDPVPKKAKKKKKKKPRLPKGYDATLPNGGLPAPDPERWLPKWQRSEFKKKNRRRREKEAVKGSQGAGKIDDALDRTKGSVEAGKGESSKSAKPSLPQRKGGKGGRK